MFQHILVPLDGSPCAEQALPGAIRIARKTGASITLLQVIPPSQAMVSPMEPTIVVADIAPSHLTVTSSVMFDTDFADIPARLAEVSKSLDGTAGTGNYDMIALTTHGRRGLARWIEGSIRESVFDLSRLPLLTLHVESERVEQQEPLPLERKEIVHDL